MSDTIPVFEIKQPQLQVMPTLAASGTIPQLNDVCYIMAIVGTFGSMQVRAEVIIVVIMAITPTGFVGVVANKPFHVAQHSIEYADAILFKKDNIFQNIK